MIAGSIKQFKEAFSYFYNRWEPILFFLCSLSAYVTIILVLENIFLMVAIRETYAYQITFSFLMIVGHIWFVAVLLNSMENAKKSILATLILSLKRAARFWWFILWIIVMRVSFMPIIQARHFFGEFADFVVLSGLTVLFLFQGLLNFFAFPAIATGKYSFIKFVTYVTLSVKKYGQRIIKFLLVFAGFSIIIFISILVLMAITNKIVEFWISGAWLTKLFQMLIADGFLFFIFTLLGIAQAQFYIKKSAHIGDKKS